MLERTTKFNTNSHCCPDVLPLVCVQHLLIYCCTLLYSETTILMFTKFSKEESIVLTKQATKAILNILKYQKSFGYFAPDDKLLDSLVLPILCYLSEI